MESLLESKDRELLAKVKTQLTSVEYANSIRKITTKYVDCNLFRPVYNLKFSLPAEDIQDIFNMYEGEEAINIFREMIIQATSIEISRIESEVKATKAKATKGTKWNV